MEKISMHSCCHLKGKKSFGLKEISTKEDCSICNLHMIMNSNQSETTLHSNSGHSWGEKKDYEKETCMVAICIRCFWKFKSLFQRTVN